MSSTLSSLPVDAVITTTPDSVRINSLIAEVESLLEIPRNFLDPVTFPDLQVSTISTVLPGRSARMLLKAFHSTALP